MRFSAIKNKSTRKNVPIPRKATMAGGPDALSARLDALIVRIATLEARAGVGGGADGATLPPSTTPPTPTQARLDAELAAKGVTTRAFVRVPPDYYDHPLAWRAGVLSAPSVDHLVRGGCGRLRPVRRKKR